MSFHCSVCNQDVSGDLVNVTDHTERHIVDLIKHDHPNWVEQNGVCQKCLDYYRSEINGSIFKDAPCAIRMRKVRKLSDWFNGLFAKE